MEPELTQILNPLTAEAKRGVPCIYYILLAITICIYTAICIKYGHIIAYSSGSSSSSQFSSSTWELAVF